MQAIEFDTYIKHNVIQLPLQFQFLENSQAKVIVLYPDALIKGNYNKQALLLSFAKAQQKNVFKNISNSVIWEKQVRDELY
jgi:hypothetical protein